MKSRRKLLSILITLSLLVTLLVPMVGPASASATYSAGTTMKVTAGEDQNIGSVKISVPAAELQSGQYVTLRLPTDFKLNLATGNDKALTVNGAAYDIAGDSDVQIRIPTPSNALKPSNTANMTVDVVADNEMKIKFGGGALDLANDQDTAYFYVDFKNVFVASGFSGDVNVTFEGGNGSPFVDGKVTVATVGSGNTNITIDSVKSITTSVSDIDILRFKEDRPGAFESGKYIKLKLPTGFAWDKGSASIAYSDGDNIVGMANIDATVDDGRTLQITSVGKSTNAAYFLIKGLKVIIKDETIAKTGDVTVTVSGTASSTPGDFVVATYGDYSVKAYAVGDTPTVMAGRTGVNSTSDKFTQIGKFAIEESVKGSLVKDRTITLTLSEGAKWAVESGKVKDITIDTADSKNYSGVLTGNFEVIGTAGDTARLTVSGTSTDTVKAVFKNAKISVSPEAKDDIKLTVGGSAGATGEFVVAKVMKPVTVKVDGDIPNVIIGEQSQELAPIVITENVAEAINNQYYDSDKGKYVQAQVRVEFPNGVLPSNPSKVEVTAGDLVIDPNSIGTDMSQANNKWSVVFNVKSTSTTPSTIKISGIKLVTDRTVPAGDLKVAIKGTAVCENGGVGKDFAATSAVASGVVAKCVTPAPVEQKFNTVFKIGDTKFTMNGVEKTMDVAPYLKNDRTYLPIRYVAQALGVSDSNIIWNADEQTVVLIRGGNVVKLTIGSTTMMINGTPITMDVAPEIVDPGRTMLPLRWVAQALGADVQWDAATQTVIIK